MHHGVNNCKLGTSQISFVATLEPTFSKSHRNNNKMFKDTKCFIPH